MGVTEWEFSMLLKIQKCRATVRVMNFDTEDIDKHPLTFVVIQRTAGEYQTESTKLSGKQGNH
jgi:hypothetical protein